ncbi:C2H2-type zinc finger protein [Haloglomus litoreum]|uniref:C2H2-type zinc finger protein n=1 Tax=Haloglomus litoreum TaxID=3034026 RepID=UPI0023E87894|nr:C2H2-type zinc finger protein [Haloglomus sp. DT116]
MSTSQPTTTTDADHDTSDGADGGPPFDCAYCARQFHRESYLALHRGQEHAGELTAAEHAAFETAREDEEEELRLFRLQALAALVFIYFGFLLVYAFSL